MKDIPILMTGAMVRATLEDRKTNTRRVVKRIPCQCGEWRPAEMCATTPEGWQTAGHSGRWWCECCTSEQDAVTCPYGRPGDRLWVRETWGPYTKGAVNFDPPVYRADSDNGWLEQSGHSFRENRICWKPSIHMPRWASRITLEVTGIRVERLNDITEEDAVAEGCYRMENGLFAGEPHRIKGTRTCCTSPLYAFERVWESINGPGSWVLNPYVWVIEFRRVKP